jgi:DNA repair protein RecO (recombination protein O)
MQWTEDGLVLGVRKHGESSVILELMTRQQGRHLGLVHGGRSKRLQPILQPGNTVHATWRARLHEQLGTYTVEGSDLRAARFIGAPLALYGLGAAAALLRLLPERDPHAGLYDATTILLEHLDEPLIAPALFVRFEVALLAELGFGLDLDRCAATGSERDLLYVSPRSGRAVSAEAGEPYREKLLRLPGFLSSESIEVPPSRDEIRAGFALTEYFLDAHLFGPRGQGMPEERMRFVALATRDDA